MTAGGTRFIRVRGKIVPIRGGGSGKGKGKGKGKGGARGGKMTEEYRAARKTAAIQNTLEKATNVYRGGVAGGFVSTISMKFAERRDTRAFNSRAVDLTQRRSAIRKRMMDLDTWSAAKRANPSASLAGDITTGYADAIKKFSGYASDRFSTGASSIPRLTGKSAGGKVSSSADYVKSSILKGNNKSKFFEQFVDYQKRLNSFESSNLGSSINKHNINLATNRWKYRNSEYVKRGALGAAAGVAAVGGYYYLKNRLEKRNARKERR